MDSLRRKVSRHTKRAALPQRLADEIRRKYDSLDRYYGIKYDPTVLALSKNPSLAQPQNMPANVSAFMGSHADICLSELGTDDIIFDQVADEWTYAARVKSRLIIYNSISDRVESWSRITNISETRDDHWDSSKMKKKSKFFVNWPGIRAVERRVLREGIGMLVKSDTLRMYLEFNKPVGRGPDGKDANFVCLEVQRVRRNAAVQSNGKSVAYGFRIELHGYPITLKEIRKRFKGKTIKVADIPVVQAAGK